jgi:hypothetical protein
MNTNNLKPKDIYRLHQTMAPIGGKTVQTNNNVWKNGIGTMIYEDKKTGKCTTIHKGNGKIYSFKNFDVALMNCHMWLREYAL